MKRTLEQIALDFECPVCDSNTGEDCRNGSATWKRIRHPHQPRVELARKQAGCQPRLEGAQ